MEEIGQKHIKWHEHYRYDPVEGCLYWIISESPAVKPGTKITYTSSAGYRQVKCKGKIWTVSRITWEMHNGNIPPGYEIDHINRVRTDDRIENLRMVTHAENLLNKGAYSTNTSGYKGLNFNKTVGKWQIRTPLGNRKRKSHGYYITLDEAICAYKNLIALGEILNY